MSRLFDTSSLPTALISTGVSTLSSKIREGASKLFSSFGGRGRNTKLTDNSPTIVQSVANLRKMEVAAENASVDEYLMSFTNNRMTAAEKEASLAALTEQTPTATQVKQQLSSKLVNATEYFVKLTEIDGDITKRRQVIFYVMPEIQENRNVDYEAVQPPQYPVAFQKYKSTQSTQWTINAMFISRTTEEATKNLENINLLRGWSMPFFGDKILYGWPNKLGAPPPVLELSGLKQQIIGPVQAVITNMNWTWQQDVDYIPARGSSTDLAGNRIEDGTLVPFPVVMRVGITLVETYSTEQVNGFSLADFRNGRFDRAWLPSPSTSSTSNGGGANAALAALAQEAQQVVQWPGAFRGQRADMMQNIAPPAGAFRGQRADMVGAGASKPVVSEINTAPFVRSPEEPLTNRQFPGEEGE